MRHYDFQLVNVFAESIFGGNPLCVFTDARGLSDVEMQALALQFNLSETTFVLPSEKATARVRIFTPTFEMAFAGHPTLGSAHVIRSVRAAPSKITLEMKAGIIPVEASADRWTFRANAPTSRDCTHTAAQLAAMLGLRVDDVLPGARWINTGSEQLIIPLASVDAVRRAQPVIDLLLTLASDMGRSMAYVFAPDGAADKLRSRFFFMKRNAIIEDPGTGSATANLGGWMLNQVRIPCDFTIAQGELTGKPCQLGLRVDAENHIFVSGRVIKIGHGTITLPAV